jgi:hypothetical protein
MRQADLPNSEQALRQAEIVGTATPCNGTQFIGKFAAWRQVLLAIVAAPFHPVQGKAMNPRFAFGRLAALAVLSAAIPAQASSWRTFVSPAGSDANTAASCSLNNPCRQFAAALSVTDPAGEIVVLASANYGAVSIDKSVTINTPPGIYAGISVFPAPANPTGNGITIATAGVSVTLKGLTINGMGGNYGIYMSNGSSLKIEGCELSGFGSSTVWVGDAGLAAIYVRAATMVTVNNTIVKDNNWGMRFGGGARAEVSHVSATENNVAIGAAGTTGDTATTVVTVSDSMAVLGYVGFISQGQRWCSPPCASVMTVTNSVASQNTYNIDAEYAGATLTVSGSNTLSGSVGLATFYSGTLNSAGNNFTAGNSSATIGITSISGTVFH